MYARKVLRVSIKYILIFFGITVFLFILYKFVPESIALNDFGPSGSKILGLEYPVFIQYFYFFYDLMTGTMGTVNTALYSGAASKMVIDLIPETVAFIIISFIILYSISYEIGIRSGSVFRNTKKLDMNIFPLIFLYFLLSLVLLTVFSAILAWLPFQYIVQPEYISGITWITDSGNGLFISKPTNIILLDAIIHHSYGVLFSYLRSLILPLLSIVIPSIIYLSTYINRISSIEYNNRYMRAGLVRDSFRDSYISKIKKRIKPKIISELKPVFAAYLGGMIIVSYVFSYMNLGYAVIYSFLNYTYGLMGGIYCLFFISIMIIIFDYAMDLIAIGDNNAY
ncbi:MAG: hypothetical protein QXZ44_05875 [Ferroplasma sp.]